MVLLSAPVWGQGNMGGNMGYGGPAVSSRGLQSVGSRGGDATSIRPYVSARGVYDSGLIVAGVGEDGEITNPGGLFGVEATVGAYGAKEWRRSRFGLDYTGLYRHYNGARYYNGSDHLLDMEFTHQLSRRMHFTVRSTGGTSSRPVGGLFSMAYLDSSRFGIPSGDVFDNRTYFLDATGQFVVNLGSRNSIGFSGNGFAVRRQSGALIGMNGHRAAAEFSRRVTRRTLAGAGYQYVHFEFPRAFGESDIHMMTGQVTREIGRNLRLSASGGMYRTDLAGIRTVQLDPVLAALFGITTAREAFNSINWLPFAQASVQHDLRKSSFLLSYTNGPSGGAGVVLTARQQMGQLAWSYRGDEKWTWGASVFYQDFAGLGEYQGKTQTFGFSANASRRITGELFFSSGLSVRRLSSSLNSNFQRTGNRIFVGLAYSPGAFPVAIR